MKVTLLETAYGKIYVPDTDTHQYACLSETGRSSEDRFISEICTLLDEQAPGTAIDAGASFGTWTLALVPHAKRVIAYEMHPAICELLYKTACENNVGAKVSIRNRALWSSKTTVPIPNCDFDVESNFGGIEIGHLLDEQPEAGFVTTEAVPLDGHINDKVTFIKIDAEGSENEVLKGAQQIIARNKPIMFIEAYHRRTNTEALKQQIVALGYGVLLRGPNFLAFPL